MKRAMTPAPMDIPKDQLDKELVNGAANQRENNNPKRPTRRNSQTFKSKDLKVAINKKRESLKFKRSWVETPTPTPSAQQKKPSVDFIKKNKTINAKEVKKG